MARTQGSHSDITGPRVRDAALSLFAQHGYAAVSMRQIAAEVGVQAGALYNYTSDKQSLLFDLLKSHMDQLLASWMAQPEAPVAMQALEQFTRFHIRFHSERPEAVFISYMELRNLTPENFAVIEELRKDYETKLEDILRAGVAQNVFSVREPKVTAMALIAMLTGVNTWFKSDGRLSLEDVEQVYWDMVRKAVSKRTD
ncbi:HTH-type transcriptional repressor KstR2 [Roseovarius litorisediminis]|uniref:HTH-type transcriptional repressor KstR2 n=1 Tax=Roseovarius litorisediminis TaxID=1312363 RepID=A0A1Y5S4F5_9RHOB|nr:TetR/AcrR family transcriptional regulator [Roseovarius litorisediminis]SLN32132.1 HTH-type transcriptional repressor KstR2 [Roseovarius litorisediminis]